MQIGFLGTGTISAAVVEGLQSLPDAPEVVVSPRSETTSLALAARFARVRRAASNAEVAAAEIVFLGMRPMHFEQAVEGIAFGDGQIVASMVAGLPLADIQARWPLARVCRFIPLPGIARGIGPIAVYPAIPEVVDLFTPLGDLFAVANESQLHFGGLNAFMSTYFQLQRALIDVAVRSGTPEAEARGFVVSLLGMLADTALRARSDAFEGLVEEHQTKGGLNERVRAHLLAAGWFDLPATSLLETTTLGYKKLG